MFFNYHLLVPTRQSVSTPFSPHLLITSHLLAVYGFAYSGFFCLATYFKLNLLWIKFTRETVVSQYTVCELKSLQESLQSHLSPLTCLSYSLWQSKTTTVLNDRFLSVTPG